MSQNEDRYAKAEDGSRRAVPAAIADLAEAISATRTAADEISKRLTDAGLLRTKYPVETAKEPVARDEGPPFAEELYSLALGIYSCRQVLVSCLDRLEI